MEQSRTEPRALDMTPNQPTQLPLAEPFARHLQNQLTARAVGSAPADGAGEVVPHEAGPAMPVEPRLAWDGATAALGFFQKGVKARALQRPTDWAALVAIHEPAAGIAFAAGNFPQLVRNLQPLLQAQDLAALRPGKAQPLH